MKFVWKPHEVFDDAFELHLHSTDGRFSYAAMIKQVYPGTSSEYWRTATLELESNPVVEALDGAKFDTKRKAMAALRKAYTVAWVGLTPEEREELWDGYL